MVAIIGGQAHFGACEPSYDRTMTQPSAFIHAAELAVDGRLEELTVCLDGDPSLVHARSAAPFGAPLLHYAAAANGVEDELQRTPANAPLVVRLLLKRGADPDALSTSYGGGPNQTALCLLVSSWHPFEAGVQAELVHELVNGGASVNGLENDSMPLATALVFGYTGAARALAECGARVDNLLLAAGLGISEQVSSFLAAGGGAVEGAVGTFVSPTLGPREISPAEAVQQAFHLAITHRQLDVAQTLLDHGASVTAASTGQHCELPVCQAVFVQAWETAEWLVERGADLDATDGKRNASAREMAKGRLG